MFGDQLPSVSASRIKDMIQIAGLETTDLFIPSHFKRNCQIILMQIAQMPQAQCWVFLGTKSKANQWEVGPCIPPCTTASALLPQLQPCVSPPWELLTGNHFFATNLKSKGNEKKPRSLQILEVFYFISYRAPDLWTCPFPEEWQGTATLQKDPSLWHFSCPWGSKDQLKFIINNVAHSTQKSRAIALS